MKDPGYWFKGQAQGGVLSPLMYLLYSADAIKVTHPKVKILQCVDDIVLYLDTTNFNSSEPLLKNTVIQVSEILQGIRLKVSPEKTKFVHFNKTGILPGQPTVMINEKPIVSTDAVKFLGIHFDYQLSFDKHERTSKTLNIVKFLKGVYWGAKPSTLISFNKSYTRSIMDYGCYVYFPTNKNKILKLERVQFSAIRMALELRISTPTNILLA